MNTNDNWLDSQNQQRPDYQNLDKPSKRRRGIYELVCSKYMKAWAILAVFVLTIPTLVYYFTIDVGSYVGTPKVTCLIRNGFRVPCGRENLTHEDCRKLLCCFDMRQKQCYHSLPSWYNYEKSDDGCVYETFMKQSPFGTETVKKVFFTVQDKSENTVRIKLEVYEGNNSVEFLDASVVLDRNYVVQIEEKALTIDIFRNKTNELLLTTAKGPLIVSNEYLEWSLYLSNGSLFGINQTLIDLTNEQKFRKVLYKNKFDHYSIPVFWGYSSGKFHAVTIFHDGPLEVTVTSSKLVLLRSLTLDSVEIEVDVGHTPKMLHDQLMKTSKVPPFWVLENHICR